MNRETALRIVLALVGLAHLALGLIANLASSETLIRIVSGTYGATIDLTPQLHHVVRILGVFMIGVGVMALWACRDPQRNRIVVMGLITILVLRVIQRIALMQEIGAGFQISKGRIWSQAILFLLIAILLFVLRPKPAAAPAAPAAVTPAQ